MTDQTEDVTPSDPSPDPNAVETPESSAAAVSAVDEGTVVGDRPLKNIIAELDRKNAQRFDELKAALFAAQARAATPAPPQAREYSDEELSQLAAAGDANAHLQLTRRMAARESATQMHTMARQQGEVAQLNALLNRYPVLRDDSHALTQYATSVKLALVRGGGDPNAVATVIESIKTAIADNPDLAASSAVRTAAPVPRATVPTGAAATPSSRRPSPTPSKVSVTDKQWEIAKRYGYKTREEAAKAVANFDRRQAEGSSRLGAVGAMIREDA